MTRTIAARFVTAAAVAALLACNRLGNAQVPGDRLGAVRILGVRLEIEELRHGMAEYVLINVRELER